MNGLGMIAAVTAAAGAVAAVLLEWLIGSERVALHMPPTLRSVARWRPVLVTATLTALVTALVWCEVHHLCLDTPEVRPTESGFYYRVAYHAVLMGLLVLATTIDFDCFLIPDIITLPGMAVGLIAAVAVQELQIAHLWVDWAYAVPQLSGPLIPEWYDQVRWAHAIAWSGTGLVVGMLLTQAVRVISSRVLQMEAMGFGDVTLMGMIGSFLGWQAVLLTFLIAPLVGLMAVIIAKLTANQRILPYGPFLSAGAVLTLLFWSRLWSATRMIFSDLVGLAMILAAALALLVLLLGAIRFYRNIPTGRDHPPAEESGAETPPE
ncbi:MAG TPA: A24 family peptidase [Planctomycetaceae bacterium]|nr:A24 family peptidase [Planctomycetaceae bacterium]